MKSIIIKIVLLIGGYLLLGQTSYAQKCGTEESAETVKNVFKLRADPSRVDFLGKAPTLYVKVQPHIIESSAGGDGLSMADLTQAFADLNTHYASANMVFNYCDPKYIKDDIIHAELVKNSPEFYTMYNNANKPSDAVNVFFVESPKNSDGDGIGGWASFPEKYPGENWVIVGNGTVSGKSTLAHEMGHYFNLLHTHSTSEGTENVIRKTLGSCESNCETAGDGFCDTPADTTLSSTIVASDCTYSSLGDDGCRPYKPDASNIMSYSRHKCRTSFSDDQIDELRRSRIHDRDFIADDGCQSIEFYEGITSGNLLCCLNILDGMNVEMGLHCSFISVANSAILNNVPAGTVIRLFEDHNAKREDSWVEIRVKQDISQKVFDNFTTAEDADARVIYHKNDNSLIYIRRYQVSTTPSGPTIDFYDDSNGEGALLCSQEIANGTSVDFTESNQCDNDRARSVILYDIPKGMRITLYDNTLDDTPFDDDRILIVANRSFKRVVINDLETSYNDLDVTVTYTEVDNLNDKVSQLVVGQDCTIDPLLIEIDQIQGLGCSASADAALIVNTTGGNPPFTYEWKNADNGSTVISTDQQIIGLSSGLYTVKVTESRDCPARYDQKDIKPSFEIDDVDIRLASCGAADGSILVKMAGAGTPPYTYQWDNATGNQTTIRATNLAKGSYSVTVEDQDGCMAEGTYTVEEDFNFRVTVRSKKTSSCNANDGWAEVLISGLEGSASILWSTGDTTARIENLAPNTYTVFILDQASNCSVTKSVTITTPGVSIQGGGRRVFCDGDTPTITLTAVSSACSGGCTYTWNTGEMTRSITVDDEGSYSVTIDDGNGCTYTDNTSLSIVYRDCSTNPGGSGGCAFWNSTATLLGFDDCTNWGFPVLHAFDPNDIAGKTGYGAEQWVSVNEQLGYLVRFENSLDFATGPAQVVEIRYPLDPNINPNSFRLSNFGFGSFLFTVPQNATAYTDRLDVRDSLGVFVDVIAGIDVVNLEAFWIFKSIDPITGLLPTDASLGFLPLTDTTVTRFNDTIPRPSEGFVSFSVQPLASSVTRDSVLAQASIVFDENAPILTNIWKNLIDAFPPISALDSLPKFQESPNFELSWTAQDDPGGVGIDYYDLYVSRDKGPYLLIATGIDTTVFPFAGDSTAASFDFYTIAVDYVGNREQKSDSDLEIILRERINLEVNVLLEGPYDQTTGLMKDDLRAVGLIPLVEPYTALGYTHVGGGGGETAFAPTLNTTGPNAVVDWVFIELRDPSDSSVTVATRSAFIQADGDIADIDGSQGVNFSTFGLSSGPYWVVIRHRTHLDVMSSTPVFLLDGEYNFQTSGALGSGLKTLNSGDVVMYEGDVNQDGIINAADRSTVWNERNQIGYLVGDSSLDGICNAADRSRNWNNRNQISNVP